MEDAELDKKLWRMRIDRQSSLFMFNGHPCPQTTPLMCSQIYMEGECWRGVIGGHQCCSAIAGLRDKALTIQIITGNTSGQRSFQESIIIGTSALEVGIDDATVQATLHYRPPRTIFDFIQRRGRAGRKPGDLAYTVMVLGKEPADYFYLTRRHRLIDGSYELPLNPDNPIVKEIHEWIEKARQEAFVLIQRFGEQEGIWKWILSKLQSCPHINAKYGSELTKISQGADVDRQQKLLQSWIERGIKEAEAKLGVEWEIPKRKEQISIPDLQAIMDDLVLYFKEWLDTNLDDPTFMGYLDKLQSDLGDFVKRAFTPSSFSVDKIVDEQRLVLESIGRVKELVQQSRSQIRQTLQSGKAWYDFFSRLYYLFENYNLIILSATVRIVYQSSYLLHQGLNLHTCPVNLPVYVPENFFGGILPMRVELPGKQTVSEPITYLSSIFMPYRVIYRYEERALYVLETRTIGTPKQDSIWLRPEATGVKDKDPKNRSIIHTRGIQLRKVQGDANQNLGVCQGCLQVYDLKRQNTTCRCGGLILVGTLYVIKSYLDSDFIGNNPIPIGSCFSLFPSLTAWTTLYGVDVSFQQSQRNGVKRHFRAWLNPALYYELPSRGIQWNVPGLSSQDRSVQLQTAANILLKTMASIVGVSEDKLAYSCDEMKGSILVWETSEGGSGLSEIFADVLQKDPLQIYQEMVATVACPIYLAEQHNTLWQNINQLIEYLADQFGLPLTVPLFTEIVKEALAETHHKDIEKSVCEKYDGCPACIKSSGIRESETPKRSIGWKLVQSLVSRIPASQWGTIASGTSGLVIRADINQGINYVLVF